MSKFVLPIATPESVGIKSSLLVDIIKRIDKEAPGVHSIIMMRHNQVFLKAFHNPFKETDKHMLYSLSKSFTSTAIGFLVTEGKLKLTDKLVDFFPEKLPFKPCENMMKITIEDMLTMRTGHSKEPQVFENQESDFQADFLRSYVDLEPGTRFVYNTPATYMLSSIVTKITGKKVIDFLNEKLFTPLDIEYPRWEEDNNGNNTGGFGLNLKTEDIARFGTMLLNGGEFYGKKIIDKSWVELATAKHTDNYGTKDWGQGYGFQFWRCVPNKVYRADGAYGQYCLVLPEQDMVVAINSGSNYMQEAIEVLWQDLLPNISNEPIKENEMENNRLNDFINDLTMPMIKGEKIDDGFKKYSGIEYKLSDNEISFEKVKFIFDEEDTKIILTQNGVECNFSIGYNEWHETKTGVPVEKTESHFTVIYEQVACQGAVSENEYVVNLCYNTTPFADLLKVKFDEQGIIFDISRNVSFLPTPPHFKLYGRK